MAFIKSERLAFLIILLAWNFHKSESLKCYQCDSWEHTGCSDNSYVDDRYYNDCYFRTSLQFSSLRSSEVPVYCLKEITTFTDLSNTAAKYHQPHVVRRCTSIPSSKVYRSNPFQVQDEYEDDCERQNVVIQSISGVRKVCSCSTDGCNSAVSLSTATFFGQILFALTMSTFARFYMTSPA